jgi:hypothetical protein
MNACTMFAWWGFNLWIPAYLSLSVEGGGIGLTPVAMSWFIVAMQVGMWFGYVTFGFISDAAGRRRTYVTYLLAAAVLMFTYASVKQPWMLLALGPFVAFFGTGYFSGFGAVTAEIYPTAIRATAGLTTRDAREPPRAPAGVGGAAPRVRFARLHGGRVRLRRGLLGRDPGRRAANSLIATAIPPRNLLRRRHCRAADVYPPGRSSPTPRFPSTARE